MEEALGLTEGFLDSNYIVIRIDIDSSRSITICECHRATKQARTNIGSPEAIAQRVSEAVIDGCKIRKKPDYHR